MRRYVAIVLASVLGLQALPLFLASTASAAPAARAGRAQTPDAGTIQGTARNAEGQVLPRQGVRLRNLDTAQVVSKTTSNDLGAFSFVGVAPANYAVELIDSSGNVVGASGAVAVAAGATTTTTVAATTALVQGTAAAAGGAAAGGAAAGGAVAGGAAAAGAAAGGMGVGLTTALVVGAVAVAAGVAGVVVVARDSPSPSN